MNNLNTLMLRLWETAAADTPQRPSCTVQNGEFVFTINGNREQWTALTAAAGVPSHAAQTINGSTLTCRWRSHADEIFGAGGLIAQRLGAAYEVRTSQLQMARLVQRAIEMQQPAVIEAGTGVGKSFAYAAICMAMGKKVCISTSNKALQMQLYRKDIPFLQQIFTGKTVALAVGKSNYACRFKAEDQANGSLTIESPELRNWYLHTESGNVEEISFAANWQELATITVDDDCGGKHCPFYGNCFYYQAKEERKAADVLITNHALLCLHTLYESAQILPPTDVLVVDEAHKLPDYARNALGYELTLNGIERAINSVEPYADTRETLGALYLFKSDLANWCAAQIDANGRLPQQVDMARCNLQSGANLAAQINELAAEVWNENDMPNDAEERRAARKAQRLLTVAEQINSSTNMPTSSLVRWMEPAEDKLKAAPPLVDTFIGNQIAGFYSVDGSTNRPVLDHTTCARCGRTLTADTVAVLEGLPYGPDCIRKVDLFGDAEYTRLVDWLGDRQAQESTTAQRASSKTTIFTSATLAAPDLRSFMAECGLPDALQMQASSPFDYPSNALLYVPNGNSPAPNDATWQPWAVEQMETLVYAAKGGAFLLFTSNAMLRYASDRMRSQLESDGYTVMVQGELPKLEIAKRFREDGNAVLFATESFFEGVSIDGDALRLVVVDKLPFAAPSPLGTAMETHARETARSGGKSGQALEMAGFNDVRVPRMIIKLKQACGRLIRTQTDRGVLAVLDPRMRTSQYGRRNVLPSLPPARLVADMDNVQSFFHAMK